MTNNQWDANDYASNSSAQLKWAQELIGKLSLQGNEQLLDLGCGDGKITAELANILKEGNVLGIDFSSNMIELAKQNFPETKHPNLSFQPMDATAIHLSQKFDVIFSNAVLHWIEDHVSVLKGISDILKPQGKILLQMGGKGNARELLPIVEEIINAPQWKDYFHSFSCPYSFYGIEEYEVWLPENGFQPKRVELIPSETYIGWVGGFTNTGTKNISVYDHNWKRIGQFSPKKVKLIRRSNKLCVV